jgi:hypothetical protein
MRGKYQTGILAGYISLLLAGLSTSPGKDNARVIARQRGHLGAGALMQAPIERLLMIIYSHLPCQASLIRPAICPRCGAPLTHKGVPSTTLSDPLIHALLDHFLLIEAELKQIRRLLVEEVLP